jgi:SpoIID/LytB domain protein
LKKFSIAILFIAVLLVFSFNLLGQYSAEAVKTAEKFFDLATAGKTAAAEDLLLLEAAEAQTLLGVLSARKLFRLTSVSAPRISSLSQAAINLSLEVNGVPYTTEVELVRVEGKWKIASFPRLDLSEASYVLSVSAGSVTLLDGTGSLLNLALSEQTPSTGEVGLAVGINGILHYFSPFEKVILNRLLTVGNNALEGEELGFFKLSPNTAFYRPDNGAIRVAETSEFIVGMTDVALFIDEGLVSAVLIPENYVPHNIRVVLNTSGFAGTSHSSVTVSSAASYTLEDKVSGKSFVISAGGALRFNPQGESVAVTFPAGDTLIFDNRLFILPTGGSKIRVDTIRRGSPQFTPSYYGRLEIISNGAALLLVNEVSIEEYLYSVVPSEMPVSFGLEALKVQAVAARSYAVSSIARSGFRGLSAHVDDSTASQVYNNVPEYEASSRAVRDTAGLVAVYDGAIIDARYFSTSSGVTANFEEVWHDRKSGAFPAFPVPYLISQPQLRSGSLPDISSEEGARSFFTSRNHNTFDSASPWFRWQVTMSRRELEASISQNLARQQMLQPSFILTLDKGAFVSQAIGPDPIGILLDLRVIRRGAGGNIMELEIVGQNGTYRVLKELNIRYIIRPVNYLAGGSNVVLARHDGSKLNNYTILPSTYLVFDIIREQGHVRNVTFFGGGNGHGVGMSQWGVRGLATDGRDFRGILFHFYPGSELASVEDLTL